MVYIWVGSSSEQNATTTEDGSSVAGVICNIVNYVQKLGLPIMTLIILGSSLMAIFGKLRWPAIVVLVVFTAVFFGSTKLIAVFAPADMVGTDNKFLCS